jgi:hypothetical protein
MWISLEIRGESRLLMPNPFGPFLLEISLLSQALVAQPRGSRSSPLFGLLGVEAPSAVFRSSVPASPTTLWTAAALGCAGFSQKLAASSQQLLRNTSAPPH